MVIRRKNFPISELQNFSGSIFTSKSVIFYLNPDGSIVEKGSQLII